MPAKKTSSSIFDRLSSTETYASKKLKEKVKKPKETSVVFKENVPVFDRLLNTDTYASRKLKERVKKPKAVGRPVFTAEASPLRTIPSRARYSYPTEISKSISSGTASTASSGRSSLSVQSRSGGSSIYDRLAYTGTKSSLQKHKNSATYVKENDTMATSIKKFHMRDYSKGSTLVFSQNRNRDQELDRSTFASYSEAEI